jgi:excisionase family DNA binding protein
MNTGATESVAVELFTIPEAAETLRVPEGWLRKKVTAGSVPHTRLGKHVRFTADHLRQIVAAGDFEPIATSMPGTLHRLSPRARVIRAPSP